MSPSTAEPIDQQKPMSPGLMSHRIESLPPLGLQGPDLALGATPQYWTCLNPMAIASPAEDS